jgi:hypothetical protein
MRWTRPCRTTNGMDSRTAKSCVLTPRRWRQPAMMLRITLGWWQESPVHQGEREASRKPFACGNAGLNRWTRGDYARVLCFFRTRGCGCIEHPAFPTPSPRKRLAFVATSRDMTTHDPGEFSPRECRGVAEIGYLNRERGPPLPLRERHRPPLAAVLKQNAEAKLRLCRIARCDPGEGFALSNDLNPSPQPSPQGERELTFIAETLKLNLKRVVARAFRKDESEQAV